MPFLVPALRHLAVETGQGCLELAPPGVCEHLLEDVDVLAHMIEHVHAGRRIVQHQTTHRILDQRLELPEGQAIGQVGVGAQERA